MNVTRVVPGQTSHVNAGANISAATTTQIAAAKTGIKYRVLSAVVVASATNTVKFQSNATDISASFPLGSNGGFVLPFNEHGWFETAVGEALNVNTSAAVSTGVQLQYIQMFSGT